MAEIYDGPDELPLYSHYGESEEPNMGGFDMDEKHLLQLLEQVRDQEGDWRVALEDAIDMVSSHVPD